MTGPLSIREVSLSDILPPSISWDDNIRALARATDPGNDGVTGCIPREIVYANLRSLPDDILDMVAWGFHVEGYDLLETRAEKLHVTANFFDYHRYKGTAHGLDLYFRTYLKRDLLASSPPHKSYVGASLTAEDRAAWEAPHPEVRVYPFRHSGQRVGAHVGDHASACHPVRTDAILRIGDRVTLYDPLTGADTWLDSLVTNRDARQSLAVAHIPVALPGRAGAGTFPGRHLSGYTTNHEASARVYVLEQTTPYSEDMERRHALSVRPGLDPFRVGYDWVGAAGQRGETTFPGNRWPDMFPDTGGTCLAGAYLVRSSARDRIYRRTKLFDPSRVTFDRRAASAFLGAMRIGAHRPHHGEAAVDMLRPAPPSAAFVTGYATSRRFLSDRGSAAWIDRMRRVGRMAVRLSDKILVSITNRQPVTASAGVLTGSIVAGAYQLEVM